MSKREKTYNELAKPDCAGCNGLGMIRYHFDQDDTRRAPCPSCFPNDSWAQRMAKLWKADCRERRRHEW